MDYLVVWTRSATANLADIADYIKRDSPYFASVVVTKIRSTARSLRRFPFRSSRLREVNEETVREILIYDYRLIFEIHEMKVIILMIVHSAQNLDKVDILGDN